MNEQQAQQVENEIAKALEPPEVPSPSTVRPAAPIGRSKTATAMRATDNATEHEDRAIEAALEEAVIARVLQVRGKLDLGPRDVYARKMALDWIMSINGTNSQEKP